MGPHACQALPADSWLFHLLLPWALGKLASFHTHHLDLKSGDSGKTPMWCQVPRDLVSLDRGLREVRIIVPFSRWGS